MSKNAKESKEFLITTLVYQLGIDYIEAKKRIERLLSDEIKTMIKDVANTDKQKQVLCDVIALTDSSIPINDYNDLLKLTLNQNRI
jgi:predicted transcriptional regulator